MAQSESQKTKSSLSDASELAGEVAKQLDANRKAVSGLLRVAKTLAQPWSDPAVVERALEAIESQAGNLPPRLAKQVSALAEAALQWLRAEREGRRQRLADELEAECRQAGVSLRVVTKEPLEIRLPPLAAQIDLEKGRTAVLFGRVEIASSPATAKEVLKARAAALKSLERRVWSPETFHRELRAAWAAAGRRFGCSDGWVELEQVLPEMAFAIQGRRWRCDPTPKNLTPYGKAQLLYDLHRLRAAGALSSDGWRLSLGPATGTSTRDKRKVFWVEDGEGRGAYHLTLRLVREGDVHGTEA